MCSVVSGSHRWAPSGEHRGAGASAGPAHTGCWTCCCLTPLHSLPFPGFPALAPKHSVWFLVLGSSLLRPAPALFAHSSFPLLSLLAVCLWARPLRVGMLLLFTSLSLVRFLRHIHSLLSPVTSQPHGAVAVLSLPCPLEASSE